jgi:homoserine dehydrogenase
MTRPLAIAVAGLGTVGAGVVKLLRANADIIAARAGRPIAITAVSARERNRDRGISLSGLRWYEDPVALAADPQVDVVVECIGGSEGPARALVQAAIAAGKHVVTANKALLAVHGAALAQASEARGVALAFEAAVAGGIPAIKALREGLAANRIQRVAGILNGTCNYILTVMREQKREFAFGRPVDFSAVHVEGIREVSALDIALAEELGYRIKLLGIARREEGGISTRVHPCMVPISAPIARVDGVFNAVVAEGDFVGRVMMEGRGAGEGPTASAVVADVIDIARGRFTPVWGAEAAALKPEPSFPMDRHTGAYYLRLMVVDRPGVIADVTGVLRDNAISLESMLQRGRAPGEAVPVVLTTHETSEASVRAALKRIAELNTVMEKPALIRIEAL